MLRRFLFAFVSLASLFLLVSRVPAQAVDRMRLASEIESLKEKLDGRVRQLLLVAPEDQAAYAEFLRQPDTGLIRLLPREKFDGVSTLRGGGAYYSFTRLTHEYGYGSDLSFEQGMFGVGFAGADFGFLVSLGDVPLASVSLDHAAAQFLSDFIPPLTLSGAREQQRRAGSGFQAANWEYKNRVLARTNSTYLLRSIGYTSTDALVAFRVVRQDADGSVVLLWKLLKRFPAPALAQR